MGNKMPIFFDGAMGTMLQSAGLKAGELPETWNLKKPEEVLKIHKMYAEAGADIICTNTFGANSLKFNNVDEVVKAGVRLAREAGKKVALDIGPTGKLLKPMGELSFERAYELFSEVVRAGADGSDLILLETMGDTYEIKAGVLAAKENSNLPVFVTMIFDESKRLLTGADIKSAVAMLEGFGVDAVGFNCGLGPKQMKSLLPELKKYTSLPIIINPNAGLPETVNGKTVFNVSPEEFANDMKELCSQYMGGCCGTTPSHIKALVNACKNMKEEEITEKNHTLVSSYSRCVEIGNAPVIIGERINPTGKKLLKEALRNNDLDYILKEGIAQQDKGAHILDVNVGLPEINETEMMKNAVRALQSVTPLPLQIDTSNIEAMENALRIYNGKPMINSVNGKKSSMESVFPLVKKYGGVVVCLCLDENGIPQSANGRIEIAKKIVKEAERFGIKKKDLVFDTLAMTVSTDKNGANETLRALNYIRNEMGINTVLGVSNISFGLPKRDAINSAFFTLAMENGLSAGIINPMSDSMMNSYYSFCALKGLDDNFESYISFVTDEKKSPASNQNVTLKEAIIKGLKEEASRAVEELLKTRDSLDIINNELIPALDEVGRGFGENKIFLPQLLMSADSATSAFEVIKKQIISSGKKQEKGEKIAIATVHGDIHDIGKNIVKVLLQNYGFDVFDLGKDVPAKTVLECVQKNNIKLVGLSALMTTTVPAMEETITLLHENTDAKVFVGGAVLTKSYAEMINADYYAKDAMESVRYAQRFFAV